LLPEIENMKNGGHIINFNPAVDNGETSDQIYFYAITLSFQWFIGG